MDQGSPQVRPDSIMVLCQRKQHLEQPWPIFWVRKKGARLLGTSLAHINERGQLSLEAAYGRARMDSDPAYTHLACGRPLFLKGPWTSIVSRFSPNNKLQFYAHWLLDALPRLASLDEFPADTRI